MRRNTSGLRRGMAAVAREQRALELAKLAVTRALTTEARRVAREAARQATADYLAFRETETKDACEDLEEVEAELRNILRAASDASAPLNFSAMRAQPKFPRFDAQGFDRIGLRPDYENFRLAPLSFWEKLVPGNAERQRIRESEADTKYGEAVDDFRVRENQRQQKLDSLKEAYSKQCDAATADAEAKNAELLAFESSYKAHDRDAVIEYFSLVFEGDDLPESLPEKIRVTYDSDSRQLVVERQLPTLDSIPADAGYRYVKKSDEIIPVLRKAAERRELYSAVLSQIALRTLRVALKADTACAIGVFSFNGFVDTIDPQNGSNVCPTLISVTVPREGLESIAFARVEPTACLRGLKALVSRNAQELEPVRPLVVFDMVDRRFIEKTDVLSTLDSRPNLAELSPNEFESLMTNLFEKMGLETRQTQASRDGGVDCVAWDMRPVIGGKVVIQAKRYRNTVGVSAVRDLYGTVMNEGAAKGILVTTSGYGTSAYEFVKNKPLELITGSNLLALLEEHTKIVARIDFPSEWKDSFE